MSEEREDTISKSAEGSGEAQIFAAVLGEDWQECLDSFLKEIPGFSNNGLGAEEKDLLRTTLTIRIINATAREMIMGGKGKLASFYGEVAKELAKRHSALYESLADGQGNLPPKIEERLAILRKTEI
jgi:hypothetical protein